MKKHFLSIGECLIEHRQQDDGLYFAGDTYNVALYLARYAASDFTVQYATALGSDDLSRAMMRQWRQEGLDLSVVTQLTDSTVGEYWITLDDDGERHFRYNRSMSAARQMLVNMESYQTICQAIEHADTIYLSAVTLAILAHDCRQTLYALLESARARGADVVMDNNYRAALWSSADECRSTLQQFEQVISLALYSLDDAREMYQQPGLSAEKLISDVNVPQAVIKAGLEGYWLATKSNKIEHVSVKPVSNVVDSTAAGDSFNAGFLLGRLQGLSMAMCGDYGYTLAATVVQHAGAIVPRAAMPVL